MYVGDCLFFLPSSTAPFPFALAVICFRPLGTLLSWKKLEFGPVIEWNGWSINTLHMTASLPIKTHKIQQLQQHPRRKTWRRSLAASFYGLRPLFTKLVFYPHLSAMIFLLSLQLTTVSRLHYGNTSWRSLLMKLPSPKLTGYTSLLVQKLENLGTPPLPPKTNFLKMFHSKGMYGSVFSIPAQTNESFQKNRKAPYFQLLILFYHSSPVSRSTAFALLTYEERPMHLRRMILWELVAGLQSQQALFGSVKHGPNPISLNTSQSKKSSKGTLHRGKPWLNFASS